MSRSWLDWRAVWPRHEARGAACPSVRTMDADAAVSEPGRDRLGRGPRGAVLRRHPAARSRWRRCRRRAARKSSLPVPGSPRPGASANWMWRIDGPAALEDRGRVVAHHRRVVQVALQAEVGGADLLDDLRAPRASAARRIPGTSCVLIGSITRSRPRRLEFARRVAAGCRSACACSTRAVVARGLPCPRCSSPSARRARARSRCARATPSRNSRLAPGAAGDAEVALRAVAHGQVEEDALEPVVASRAASSRRGCS